MSTRAFPVIYTDRVEDLVAFYGMLGYEVQYRFPPDEEGGYVSLRRGETDLGIVTTQSPRDLIGVEPGRDSPRFEMYLYVADLDACVGTLRGAGAQILREPEVMPWGERLAYSADPDGNPVALCQASGE